MKNNLSPLGTITTRFGAVDKSHPIKPHTGLDVACPIGSELYSPVEGYVSRVVDYGDSNIGKGVIIQTDNGYQIILGHLSSIKVKVGDMIHKGDILGKTGSSGNSTGGHVHIGLRDSTGKFIDPLKMFFDDIKASITVEEKITEVAARVIQDIFLI